LPNPNNPEEVRRAFAQTRGEYVPYDGANDHVDITPYGLTAATIAVTGGITTCDYVQFDTSYADGVAEGRLQWNLTDGTLEVGMPGGNVNLQIGQETLLKARNVTGSTIGDGVPVYITGASGSRPTIAPATAANYTQNGVIAVTTESIDHNATGYVCAEGLVRDVDTSSWPAGTLLWLDYSAPGQYVSTMPAAPYSRVAIGYVLFQSAGSGILAVSPTIIPHILNASGVTPGAPTDGQLLYYDLATTAFTLGDHGDLAGGGDDDHTQYLLHNGTRGLTGHWTNGAFNISSGAIVTGNSLVSTGGYLTSPTGTITLADENLLLSGNIAIASDSSSIQFGAGQDGRIWYNGTDLYIDPQIVGDGDLQIPNGGVVIGDSGGTATGKVDVSYTTGRTDASAIGIYSTVFFGSAGSGNTTYTIYGSYANARTEADYDGNVSALQGFRNVSAHYGSGTITNMFGSGFAVAQQASAGAVTNMYGNHIACTSDVTSDGTTNMYGLYIENIDDADTLNYSIYTNNGTVYLKGNVGIGQTVPNQKLHVAGNIKMDDNYKLVCGTGNDAVSYYDGTDYIINPKLVGTGAVKITGDMKFSGSGTGLPYAEIYAYNSNTTITISGTGIANKVQVTAFDTNGVSNLMTPDHTNDHITVSEAGVYLCNISISAESAGGAAYEVGFAVYKNNGATQFPNLHVHRNLSGAGGDTGSMSMTGLITLAANDTVEVWVYNETNTSNVIVDDITMNLVMVGG
jgi:hypothetical protein